MMNVAYYPGCSLHGVAREYDSSARLVCEQLDIGLREVEDWNCCGATAAHSLNHLLALSLAARNLGIVREMGLSQVTSPCPGCSSRLKTAVLEMRRNATIAAEVERIIEASAPVEPEVSSLLQLMVEQIGIPAIANKVVRPLKGLKVAAYYGCLLTRPRRVSEFDDPEQPVSMDHLLQALGAETVVWSHKAECCGGGYAASQTDIVIDLGGQVLRSACGAGAEAIVVACPMCQINLDTRQDAIGKDQGINYQLPIIYFTQAMGIAFGFSAPQLGTGRLLTSPIPLLRGKGLA
jgi:heterodisulfide reductase subunit B